MLSHLILYILQGPLRRRRDCVDPRCFVDQVRLCYLDPIPYLYLLFPSSAISHLVCRHGFAPSSDQRVPHGERDLAQEVQPLAFLLHRDRQLG